MTTKIRISGAIKAAVAAVSLVSGLAHAAPTPIAVTLYANGAAQSTVTLDSTERRTDHVVVKSAQAVPATCTSHPDDVANRCKEPSSTAPANPTVSLFLVTAEGGTAVLQVEELTCPGFVVRKGPNAPASKSAQFLVMPDKCNTESVRVELPLNGETVSLKQGRFQGTYSVSAREAQL